jgi:hypothetical protein
MFFNSSHLKKGGGLLREFDLIGNLTIRATQTGLLSACACLN